MCTKCNRFLNLILIKGSALKVCAGSPARRPSLFGCATRSLTVDSHTQLSSPKQLAHLIWGGFRSASCVLPPSAPSAPQALRCGFLKALCTYLVACSVGQLVEDIHYMSTNSVEFEHFSHYHICVLLLPCILRSCFPVARSYLNVGLIFYLNTCLAVGFFSVFYLKMNCCYLNFASMWNI